MGPGPHCRLHVESPLPPQRIHLLFAFTARSRSASEHIHPAGILSLNMGGRLRQLLLDLDESPLLVDRRKPSTARQSSRWSQL